MKRTLLLIAVISVFAGFSIAQDDAVYSSWMKSMNPSMTAIRAAIAAKDNPTVAAEANKLAATFEQVSGFWTQRKADDAIGFAKAARDAAKTLAAATDTDAQNAALATINAQCGSCHRAHRDGGRGAPYVIK
jgi:cytochrome c556